MRSDGLPAGETLVLEFKAPPRRPTALGPAGLLQSREKLSGEAGAVHTSAPRARTLEGHRARTTEDG